MGRVQKPKLAAPFTDPDSLRIEEMMNNSRRTGRPPDWRLIGVGEHDGSNGENFYSRIS